jgi:hypothetical protein
MANGRLIYAYLTMDAAFWRLSPQQRSRETVFPAPDLLRAHTLLQQDGMTLDSISAHVGRHITEGIGKIVREALAEAYQEGGRG